jgi:transcription elongation factor GreA
MKDKAYLTEEGFKQLKDELKHLIEVRRREVARRIAEAKEYGDLSENAEYVEAKNEQAWVEGRIQELEQLLKNVEIIKGAKKGLVGLGSTVVVISDGKEEEYTIVGSSEANPLEHKISNESPIGRAFMGKSAGEVVRVIVPAGEIEFKIKEVK